MNNTIALIALAIDLIDKGRELFERAQVAMQDGEDISDDELAALETRSDEIVNMFRDLARRDPDQ